MRTCSIAGCGGDYFAKQMCTRHYRQAHRRSEGGYPFDAETARRFWAKVQRLDNGCWVWTGSRIRAGYGQFLHGKVVSVHRASYQNSKGDIAPGMDIDHVCRNRSCVNPDHLEAVTHRENLRRGLVRAAMLGPWVPESGAA